MGEWSRSGRGLCRGVGSDRTPTRRRVGAVGHGAGSGGSWGVRAAGLLGLCAALAACNDSSTPPVRAPVEKVACAASYALGRGDGRSGSPSLRRSIRRSNSMGYIAVDHHDSSEASAAGGAAGAREGRASASRERYYTSHRRSSSLSLSLSLTHTHTHKHSHARVLASCNSSTCAHVRARAHTLTHPAHSQIDTRTPCHAPSPASSLDAQGRLLRGTHGCMCTEARMDARVRTRTQTHLHITCTATHHSIPSAGCCACPPARMYNRRVHAHVTPACKRAYMRRCVGYIPCEYVRHVTCEYTCEYT